MESSKKITIYCFSGTGNTKNTAVWLTKAADEMNIQHTIIDIEKQQIKQINRSDKDDYLAFVSAVHGFNFPAIVIRFLLQFPRGKNKVLLMNTRGATLIGKLKVPGLSGMAFYTAALILWLKGYSIRSVFPVDLPANWITLHPSLGNKGISVLYQHKKEKVIQNGLRFFNDKRNFRGFYFFLLDFAVLPISLLYMFIGRFILTKTYFASDKCNRCRLCIQECPLHAIKTVDNRPYWTLHCQNCMRCVNRCPQKAVQGAHGFIILFGYLFYHFFTPTVNTYLYENLINIHNSFLNFLVESGEFILILTLTYYVIHWLMHFHFIERIMTYTSLTSYSFWKRYKIKIEE